jgi:carboxyl-terminal processing protease
MSAAEGFTLTMRAFPTVTHAGETTRGALSDLLERPLPNGWTLTLSNEVVLDADGESWERRGIPPDLPMDVFESGNLDGRVDAILALAAQLRRRP